MELEEQFFALELELEDFAASTLDLARFAEEDFELFFELFLPNILTHLLFSQRLTPLPILVCPKQRKKYYILLSIKLTKSFALSIIERYPNFILEESETPLIFS